jgi:AbrB family looped-hinge helix DNA binding protein
MTKCPLCETEMRKERKEIEKGVWATVEVCPHCKDEWIDEKEHDRLVDLFKRKTFNLGGSIAVRIPKEIADALSIQEGTEVNFSVQDKKIIISKATA